MIMAMKESGIEWVGLIPDTWSVIPNKYVMHKEKNLCEKWTGEDVMSLTMNGVIVRDLQNPTGKMPASFDGYQYIEDGDLLMCLFDIDVTPRCVGKVTHNGVTSPAYSNFKVHDNASRDYFYYYYLMVDNTKELLHLAKNLRHSFTEEQLGQLKVPMPPLSEQQAIADYLDETCSKIDEIIAKAKASIDEYKELKQSVIFEAVTKGLDKNVEMKDSGVYWIGKIPLDWEIIKTKYVIKIENGSNPSTEGKIPVYGSGAKSFKTCGEYKEGPTVLLGRKGATLHIPHYIEGKYWNVDTAFNTIPINNKIELKYFYYVASCFDYNKYISQTTLPGMTQTNYRNIYMPYPSITIQEELVKWLDNKIFELDSLISEKESLINNLESYKKSLIYEVVTGKRRVV